MKEWNHTTDRKRMTGWRSAATIAAVAILVSGVGYAGVVGYSSYFGTVTSVDQVDDSETRINFEADDGTVGHFIVDDAVEIKPGDMFSFEVSDDDSASAETKRQGASTDRP